MLGLIGAPVVFMGLAGWAYMQWRRYGKDPVYLDDPSILMPAPPPDLTAASGAFVMDGGTSRRALTTAMLDLASRGLMSFREDRGLLGLSNKVGIEVGPPTLDPVEEARRALNARRPIGPAEEYALKELRELGSGKTDGFIDAEDLPKFGTSVSTFDSKLESHVVNKGWMVEKPSKVVSRWAGKGVLVIIAGGIALFAGINVPIAGLVLIGVAAIAGGIVILGFARGMPAVTMPGAMIRAMLAAYRRTLQKTMEQARSMEQVVERRRPRVARDAGPGRGLGDRPRTPGRDRTSPREEPRGRAPATVDGVGDLLPGVVPHVGRIVVRERHRSRERRQHLLRLRRSGRWRHDVRARHDRELAGVVGEQRRRRLQRRWVGRRRRRLGRRVLARRPEHLAAPVEALDLDRWSRPGTPALLGHPEALGLARDPLWGEGPAAVVLVADRA